jgi:hypothetical protein
MNKTGFQRFRAERVVFHGTRKNAVNNLLEVGCSEARVAAIVNMSPPMVHHYSKKVNQFGWRAPQWSSSKPDGRSSGRRFLATLKLLERNISFKVVDQGLHVT